MFGRGDRIRESKVCRYHGRADAVREREIHAVVNRVVEGQCQTHRIGGYDFIGAPHAGMSGTLASRTPAAWRSISHLHLAPQCVGNLGSHKVRCVQVLAARCQLPRYVRILFHNQPI